MAVASALLLALAGACTPGGPPAEDGPPTVSPQRADQDRRTLVPAPWTLLGTTPDERILTVAFQYGGAASGCQGFQDAVVDEGPEQVVVSVRLWDAGRTECSLELIGDTVEVVLGRPLGQRALSGCAPAPGTHCRALGPETAAGQAHAVTAAGEAVVAAGRGAALGVDPDDGRVRWEQPVAGADVGLEIVGTTVYVRADDDIVALDAATGDQRWRSTALRSATGPPAIDAGRVFGAARADQTVVALDAATGALVWSAG
ncbi:MAG TPA: PQQ-binding-like beta-propeller repeat protein, partial [Egibacteraceae bacterium]|nr:PQQ-binding-like beta-propeller repeat protein [Egibacteraceae bacterium]